MEKIKVGIIGGAGYTAGELLRILINHPETEIVSVQSDSNAGAPIGKVHQDLFHIKDLLFTNDIDSTIDVVFLCKGHGESVKLLDSGMINPKVKIIDLSHDFRLKGSREHLKGKYGEFIYGLPELNKAAIKTAKNIANPGCFATCIQLGLLPLAEAGVLNDEVHISAITGSTGAGQKLASTSHFTWRNNNMSVYKAFNHQHLLEISESINQLQTDFDSDINFIPYRGNFTRGIIATSYIETGLNEEDAISFFKDFYKGAPFVNIADDNINLKQVVNTNFCQLYIEKIGSKLMVISTIDNLIKGASGQAVQNMNLMFGLDETVGLKLKGVGF